MPHLRVSNNSTRQIAYAVAAPNDPATARSGVWSCAGAACAFVRPPNRPVQSRDVPGNTGNSQMNSVTLTARDEPPSGCRGPAKAGAVLLLVGGAVLMIAGTFEQYESGGGWYGGIAGWFGFMCGLVVVCIAIAILVVLKMSE